VSHALDTIRVVDLSTGIAGPIAAMLLADFGADVIKVEPPAGDPARSLPGFAVWNRNKRGIVIERDTAAGQERLARVLAGADLCILSEPAIADEPRKLSATYSHLVVVHTPPYTPTHTPWAGGAESHGLLDAFAGPSARQSSFDGGPIDLVYPTTLYVQGSWVAAAAVAALIERQHSGFGQVVTVAGIHGVMICCSGQFNVLPSQQPLPTNVGPGGRHPCYTTYQAQDGRWLFLAALTQKFQANAFRVLGIGDLFADERIAGLPARILLPENRGWVRAMLADAFRTRPRDEWVTLLEQGDCPAGPLGERDTWLDHPQVRANGVCAEVVDPQRGPVLMPGVPLVLTDTPGQIRAPAPTLGQHNRDTIDWPARPHTGGSPPTAHHGPLAGYRVLDLGAILAAPYAGALLAELGADVIKVEPPEGDAFRETGFVYNRGQRGLAIDLRSAEARQAFYDLVRTADAVVDNSRLGVIERLRIDYANLASVKPDIVTMSVNGFGEHGPMAPMPGFDPVLQAMSGMMSAQGGDSDPVLFTIPVNDIAAATLVVLGVCLGIFHRLRTGRGQRMWTSLAGCATLMQSGELVRFAGRPPAVRGGRDFTGPSAMDRIYRVQDGWLRVQAPHADKLRAAGLLPDNASAASDAELGRALAEALAPRSLAEALACLSGAAVPAAALRGPHELPLDPDLRELEVFAEHYLQDGTPYLSPHRYARFSRTQTQATFEPPGLGEHSRQVLAEAGLDAARIQALLDAGVVKQGEPFRLAAIQTYR
jgi:crotonobetainyl-CoA:carnitine CoA-transferase CaiB-like acyl-CoA transferase